MTTDRWRRAEALFHEMLARPAAERAAALAAECSDDPGLQAAVQSLLDQPNPPTEFLEAPAAEIARLLSQPGASTLSGRRLGVFELQELLGVGGMGEVYRARDTRLGRDVAIKILSRTFGDHPARLARLEREARVLASLNHPHIGAIYGLEESDGIKALVLEVVEGEDLAQRIARGPMSLTEVLPIAKQIADALEAAHEQGIIHRDLKPANIKVRPDGVVKVLDFGLAKAVNGDQSGPDLSQSPSLTLDPAVEGIVLGTAAYMSPEQARGTPVNKRTDIWAFGCVLFEMLTGTRAFEGTGMSDTIAAVLRSEPAWTRLGPRTPEPIRTLLERCLEKDPSRRMRDIGDARLELDASDDSVAPDSIGATTDRRKERLAWMAAVTVIALIAIVMMLRPAPSTATRPEEQFDITTPVVVGQSDLASFALSPDGEKLVFVAALDGRAHLWMRRVGSVTARPLSGTQGAAAPFWSPDGRSVAFYADRLLKRLDLDGGLVRGLTSVEWGSGGTWNNEGTVLFARSPAGPILRISVADGAVATPVTRLGSTDGGHTYPHFLRDGRHFLYFVQGSSEDRGVYLGQLDGRDGRRLFDSDSAAVYVSGHLLFVRKTTVYAYPFDDERLTLTGAAFEVADGALGTIVGTGPHALSAAPNGTIGFRVGVARPHTQFVWVDRSGHEIRSVGDPDSGSSPSASPALDQVAVLRRNPVGNSDIWLMETRRGLLSRFTTHPAEDIFPYWSRDGRSILFSSNRNAEWGIYRKPAIGGAEELLLRVGQESAYAFDSSPDGHFLLYQRRSSATGWDLWTLPLNEVGASVPVAQSESDERNGQFSPDGKWIAYESNSSGPSEVFMQPFPARGKPVQVSTKGGAQPRWRADGKELFYIALDGTLMAVPVRTTGRGESVPVNTPVRLFAARIGAIPNERPGAQYIVSADGQRFLMNTFVHDASSTPIRLILNWSPAASHDRSLAGADGPAAEPTVIRR